MVYEISSFADIRTMSFNPYEDSFHYQGITFPGLYLSEYEVKSNGLDIAKKAELVAQAIGMGVKDEYMTRDFVKELYRAEHKKKEDSVEKFIEKYKHFGFLKCKMAAGKGVLPKLEQAFNEDRRFHGRVPRIAPEMAAICGYFNVPVNDMVEKFSIQPIKQLREGASKLSGGEAALLCATLPANTLSALSANPQYARQIALLMGSSLDPKVESEKIAERYKNAALWVANHLSTDDDLVKRVVKNAEDIRIKPESSVDAVETALAKVKSLNEVKKVEKAYKKPGFKLRNCTCELHRTSTTTGKYHAEILEPTDPLQVMLGQLTDCCQYLGEAGESSMMHGLCNPKAGFWVLTNNTSGKVLAQAEVWEENADTLVFDNIEFANDADIALYRDAISDWIAASPYPNIKMGAGYNEIFEDMQMSGDLRSCGSVVPPVTPYEIYVMSYEEDAEWEGDPYKSEEEARIALENGDVTYFDFLYCDSENRAVWMKENGNLEPYFAKDKHTIEVGEKDEPDEEER